MIVEIFDVEHGACALITTAQGRHILIDCGTNSSTGWKPGSALAQRGIHEIERLIVTNYDEDHASGYRNLLEHVYVRALQRNGAVTEDGIHELKSESGIGSGIKMLAATFQRFTGPTQSPIVDDVEVTAFFNNPGIPPLGFDDENNLSLVAFLSCGEHRIVFPGDMEKAGWLSLLQNPAFRQMLLGVNIFVASHHGRDSGYCQEVMNLCPNLRVVIISDKKKGFQSQETTPLYRKHARGFIYHNEERRVLTTRSDGSMAFDMPAAGVAQVYLGIAA